MENIAIRIIDSTAFYQQALRGQATEDDFRYQLMAPLEKMWQYLNAPLKPKSLGGYDVVMASEMMGIWTPRKSNQLIADKLEKLVATNIFTEAPAVLRQGISAFAEIGYQIPVTEIVVTILLGDSEKSILMASEGYSGFGGIPGFIFLVVVPNHFNQSRLKSALAHELNHNVRFTYAPFNHGDVSVEEYLVIEGLAEVFAEKLYGIDQRGPWVQNFTEKELADSIDVMKAGRQARGFEQVAAYMYGDAVAKAQGYAPVGLSRNAGYTVGYHLVKKYLKNTGASIEKATLTPSAEIIKESKIFD
ncbi:DUF2268 domain-containing protein [Enterococcus sp. HY326]|uniref:DUF2268 domain-containing protein n=1 Tax=Enterococcus sp. HY326 TaxID=2971265 RepID=UPI00223F00C7|nr:DUF2268 domain-containing protein [Enterococcus sp. HY326]